MADYIKSFRDGVLSVVDGTATPIVTVCLVAEGDLKIKETSNVVGVLDRGTLHEIKVGDEAPIEVSFGIKMTGYQVGSVTALEAIKKTGAAAAFVSTRAATTQVYTVDLKFEVKGVNGSTEETITVSDFYWESCEMSEGDPNMFSVSGKAWSTAVVVT